MIKVSNGVAMLELKVNEIAFHPTLVWDDESAILIDAGVPGQLEAFQSEMTEAGVPFSNLKAVILTHQDIDHIGSLPELQEAAGHSLEVYAHENDQPYIEGRLPLIKTDRSQLTDEEWESLPPLAKAFYEIPSPVSKVHHTLKDGQTIPLAGGMKVIFTPGHTPGHISLYLQQSKVLVAGDAMFSVNGNLHGPHEETTPDLREAEQSITKYSAYDIHKVICYHGGLSTRDVKEQLMQLVLTADKK